MGLNYNYFSHKKIYEKVKLSKMNSKQDFGRIDDSNDAWIRLKGDLKEWEYAHPTNEFISPKAFKMIYPFYECFTKQSFSEAYYMLLEERCKYKLWWLLPVANGMIIS